MGEVLMVARQTPNLKDRVRFLAPMPTLSGRVVMQQTANLCTPVRFRP